ncbi:MAG: tetratricopeptide repeat protein, partial [Myxococcota bacterium]|nr:tetratricopeptide repeat protein [Myxococcota bacterium]
MSTGPRRLETPWLERAEALAPHNHKVILTRYKVQPSQAQAVKALESLTGDEATFSDFDAVQTALRILAEHRSLPSQTWTAALAALEPTAQPHRCLELGLLWQAFDDHERAESNLKLWLSNAPNHPLATLTLARLLLGQGRAEEAFQVLTALPREDLFESLELVEQLVEATTRLQKYELALAGQQVLAKRLPNHPGVQVRLAQLYNFNGLNKEELEIYDKWISHPETKLHCTLLKTFSTPLIYRDEEEVEATRARLVSNLDLFKQTAEEATQSVPEQLHAALYDHTNFSLGYQQFDDLPAQRIYGEALHALNTKLVGSAPARPSSKKRPQIAFFTHFTWSHTVGKLFHRWITGLSDAGFEVGVVSTSQSHDRITEKIKAAASSFQSVTPQLSASVTTLRELESDIVIFPELGMDALALGVAATRNAPIQCMAWGHPITSGLPTMDYFLTSQLMEPSDGQRHYSEKLIELPGLSIEFAPPTVPHNPHTRTQLGLPEGRTLLLSCQTLYKLLPRYDRFYVEVLKASPLADLVFIANRSRYVTDQFRLRMHKALAQEGLSMDRLHIVGPFPHAAYLSLNLACDVFLDAHGWSGGNTTLEALNLDLPIVTTPGKYMRGRHSAAILKQLDLEDSIAESVDSWVQKASAYANDPALRKASAANIKAASNKAYRDPRVIEGLATSLIELYNK